MLADFEDDLRVLGGTRSEATTYCLSRYFYALREAKKVVRAALREDDRAELAELAQRICVSMNVGKDFADLANAASDELRSTLVQFNVIERMAILDAMQRTKASKRSLRKNAVEPSAALLL